MMMVHQSPPGFGRGLGRQSEHPAPPAAICTSGKTPGGGPCGTGPPKATTLVVQCAHGIRVCQIASEDRLVV